MDSKEVAGNLVGISSTRNFQVYLPDEYHKKPDKRYPVLYWVPGWTSGLTGFQYVESLDDAIVAGTIPATIAVFIDAVEGITFLSSTVFGNWEAFLISELIPFIDREYRTIQEPLARALMGHSMGGYTALMLPLLHPGIWGSVGGNDPAFWTMSFYIGGANLYLADMPKNFDERAAWPADPDIMMQFGAAFTPNPDAPLLCDFPVTKDARDKWNEYNLMNNSTLEKFRETLNELLCIAIVTPTGAGSLGPQNTGYINSWTKSGINNITRLDMPGSHGGYEAERFIAMAEQILWSMVGADVSVSPQGSMTMTWGAIKRGQ